MTYIGPSIEGLAPHMTTFTGKIPELLLELAQERCKALRQMIVPAARIAEKVQATRKEGTAEFTLYNKVKEFLQLGAPSATETKGE